MMYIIIMKEGDFMQMKTLVCPNCKGQLSVNWSPGMNTCFCNFCGSQILIDDGSTTTNFNYTYREIDDARIREAEANERIRIHEINTSHEESKSAGKVLLIFFIILFSFMLIFFLFMRSNRKTEEEERKNKVRILHSASYYTGENYEVIIEELKATGFNNIETYPLGDLKIGLISKENDVDKISINGNDSFKEGGYYEGDSLIKIYYHSYPDKESKDNANNSSLQENNANISEPDSNPNNVSMPYSVDGFKGKDYSVVINDLKDAGFTNIELSPIPDLVTGWVTKDGEVESVSVDGNSDFSKGDRFSKDSKIRVDYHTFEDNVDERIKVPNSYYSYSGEDYEQTVQELKDAGFTDIESQPLNDLNDSKSYKVNKIDKISINGETDFTRGTKFEKDAKIRIYYHSYARESSSDKSNNNDSIANIGGMIVNIPNDWIVSEQTTDSVGKETLSLEKKVNDDTIIAIFFSCQDYDYSSAITENNIEELTKDLIKDFNSSEISSSINKIIKDDLVFWSVSYNNSNNKDQNYIRGKIVYIEDEPNKKIIISVYATDSKEENAADKDFDNIIDSLKRQ